MADFQSLRGLTATMVISALWSARPVKALTYFAPTRTNPCRIGGDIDIYGPGARIGYYLQWLSIFLAIYILPKSSQAYYLPIFRVTTTVLAVAILITTVTNLIRSSDTSPESPFGPVPTQLDTPPLIILDAHIIYSLIFLLPMSLFPISFDAIHESKYSLFAQMLVAWITNLAQPWLWFKGVKLGNKEGCDVRIALIMGSVSVYNTAWERLFRGASVIAVILVIVAVFTVSIKLWTWRDVEKEREIMKRMGLEHNAAMVRAIREISAAEKEEGEDSNNSATSSRTIVKLRIVELEPVKEAKKVEGMLRWPLMVRQVLGGGLAIVQTEMTIRTSGIEFETVLTSSGQMVALVIGVATLLITLGHGVSSWRTSESSGKEED
ncbi:hypothetical protein B0J14DRAFT_204419 [Halenospora varia]|nr:hypothetical protein B0J14DRAFT_204419 [Halenospora varia]